MAALATSGLQLGPERAPHMWSVHRLGMSLSCDSSTQTELAFHRPPEASVRSRCLVLGLRICPLPVEGQRDNLCRAPGILTSPVRAAFNCPS